MKDLQSIFTTNDEQEERLMYQGRASRDFLSSVQTFDWNVARNITVRANYPEIESIYDDDRTRTKKLGIVETIFDNGSLLYISKYIIQQVTKESLDICEWADEVADKGYCMWCFSDHPSEIFTDCNPDVDSIKEVFSNYSLEGCETLGDLEDALGDIEPVGVNDFLIDDVICSLSSNEDTIPVRNTRLTSMSDVIDNLRLGIMIPMKVSDAIYCNNESLQMVHYVALVGIENGTAIVADPTCGMRTMSIEKLIEATTAEAEDIALWDVMFAY